MRGLFVLLGLGACIGGMHDPTTVEQQNGACFALEGRTFVSVQQPGSALAFATGDADSSELIWNAESGRVECRGQAIIATRAGRTVAGVFDPVTQVLTWAGEIYVAQ